MAGEAVDEVVLAAMSLIGDDYDVAAIRKNRVAVAPLFREELLEGSEDHASGGDREFFAQVGSVLSLSWRLMQEIGAAGERAEELIV